MDNHRLKSEEIKYVFDLHRKMLNQHLILVYEGEFSQEITKGLLQMTERKIGLDGGGKMVQRRIFRIMVECLQNISLHSARPQNARYDRSAIFSIGKGEDKYYVSTGNLIENNELEELQNKLNQINNLDKDGLKELYKKVLKEPKQRIPGKTGLGLIDIALKSGEKLNFDFIPVNDSYSFYAFQTQLKTN